jgi:hypothetical protein
VPRAEAILAAEGYRPEFRFNPAQAAAFLRYDCEHPFVRETDHGIVEVHWRFEPWHFSFPLDVEPLWDRLVAVTVHGVPVRTLKPEDLIIVLSVHGAKHAWNRFAWVCDIAQVIVTTPAMDWRETRERAARLGVTQLLLLGLYLACELTGAEPPPELRNSAYRNPVVRRLGRRVMEQYDRGEVYEPDLWDFCLFHVWARERLGDRARYIFRRITTTSWEDWAALPLPAHLFWLYYVLRPITFPLKMFEFWWRGSKGLVRRGGHLSKHWSTSETSGDGATPPGG